MIQNICKSDQYKSLGILVGEIYSHVGGMISGATIAMSGSNTMSPEMPVKNVPL